MQYVLPELRMTSCFHTTGPMGRIKHDVMFRRVRQVAVPVGRQTINQSIYFDVMRQYKYEQRLKQKERKNG